MRKPGCAVLTEIELLQITRHGGTGICTPPTHRKGYRACATVLLIAIFLTIVADDVMNMERVIRPRNKKTFESVYQVYEVLEALVSAPQTSLPSSLMPMVPRYASPIVAMLDGTPHCRSAMRAAGVS